MTISPTLSTGLQGVQQGVQGAQRAAQDIVRAGAVDGPAGSNDVAEPLIDLKLYQRSVEASAQVVKTADETLGTLLDVMA